MCELPQKKVFMENLTTSYQRLIHTVWESCFWGHLAVENDATWSVSNQKVMCSTTSLFGVAKSATNPTLRNGDYVEATWKFKYWIWFEARGCWISKCNNLDIIWVAGSISDHSFKIKHWSALNYWGEGMLSSLTFERL